jgi:hypothetical protein
VVAEPAEMAAAGCVEALTARAEQHAAGLPRGWVATLTLDPAITRHWDPDALLNSARAAWHADQIVNHWQRAYGPPDTLRSIRHDAHPTPQIDHGPSIGR